MLDHVSIGVADTKRSKSFYDAVLKPLGYSCLSNDAAALGYGKESSSLWILKVEHPVKSDLASGLHFCFTAPTRKSVDEFHRAALANGGRDNGKPGVRSDYGANYYAAFVVDPDGYRLEAYSSANA